MSYAAVYSFTYTLMTDRGWLGVLLMMPAMIWCGVFAVGMTSGPTMFRASREGSSGWIITKTLVQIIVLWSLILGVIPYLLTLVENKLGVERLAFPYRGLVGVVAFILISCIGLWAGYVMSRFGRGTPLPLDHARHLVIRGPYKYVRNPMAVSGIGQGLAVALILGSPLTVLYALMGSLIWQLIFRPLEEDDLEARFGKPFREYCKNVRCWIPRLTPYQIEGTSDSSNSVISPSGRM
jgi:protein-S-isoprenylcysteine O-methyltransferase Ste14